MALPESPDFLSQIERRFRTYMRRRFGAEEVRRDKRCTNGRSLTVHAPPGHNHQGAKVYVAENRKHAYSIIRATKQPAQALLL
jgi:hypothetical protein